MTELDLIVQGTVLKHALASATPKTATTRKSRKICIPVRALGDALGWKIRDVVNGLVLCRQELCLPIIGQLDGGDIYEDIDVLANALGLKWRLEDNRVHIWSGPPPIASSQLGVGQVPPDLGLSDINGSEVISISSFAGRKTVLYIWASW